MLTIIVNNRTIQETAAVLNVKTHLFINEFLYVSAEHTKASSGHRGTEEQFVFFHIRILQDCISLA